VVDDLPTIAKGAREIASELAPGVAPVHPERHDDRDSVRPDPALLEEIEEKRENADRAAAPREVGEENRNHARPGKQLRERRGPDRRVERARELFSKSAERRGIGISDHSETASRGQIELEGVGMVWKEDAHGNLRVSAGRLTGGASLADHPIPAKNSIRISRGEYGCRPFPWKPRGASSHPI
jgi:hypothetical protein